MAGLDLGQVLGGLLGNLGTGIENFANSSAPLPGIVNLVKGVATGQPTDAQGIAQQNLNATYQAARNQGMSHDQAVLFAANPEYQKLVINRMFQQPTYSVTGEDMLGNKQYGFVNTQNMTVTPAQTPQAPQQTGTMAPPQGSPVFAPGVKAIDSSLAGEDYLKQFAPELQQQVKDYLSGKVSLTGRQQSAQAIKRIAEKYGADVGTPADENTIMERRKLQTGLAGTQAGTAGGQINAVNTGIGHLLDLAKAAENLDNFGVSWLPASASHVLNNMKNSGPEGQAKIKALQDIALKYGQEITKFYAGSPGGEAERQHFQEAVAGANTPQELASVIRAEAELLPSKVEALRGQIGTLLGPEGSSKYPVLSPASQKRLDEIDAISGRMVNGTRAPSQSQQNIPRVGSAAEAAKLPRGSQFYDPNGVLRRVP